MTQAASTQRKINRPLVVLPTYNEVGTLGLLLDALMQLDVPLHVLVVDDSSPDGTADLVRNYSEFSKRVFLMQRPGKMGLASAYKDGFKWGLENDYEVCMEMDSDLSHDPRDVPKLIKGIEDGADIAIGSRYLNGISVINWPLRRLLISMGAGVYTRLFSRVRLTDPTSGFKAIHRDVLEKMDWDKITSDGYGFQIEVHFFSQRMGFTLKEISIVFTERRNGESKFSNHIIFEAAFRVIQLGFMALFNTKPPIKKEYKQTDSNTLTNKSDSDEFAMSGPEKSIH